MFLYLYKKADSCLKQKYSNRLALVDAMIRVHETVDGPVLRTWKKLRRLVLILDADGMSDEETEVEDNGHTVNNVLKVSVLSWRRGLGAELATIDAVRFLWASLFDTRGAKPMHRLRNDAAGPRPVAYRDPYKHRPKSFYSPEYLETLSAFERSNLHIVDNDEFEWFTLEELGRALER